MYCGLYKSIKLSMNIIHHYAPESINSKLNLFQLMRLRIGIEVFHVEKLIFGITPKQYTNNDVKTEWRNANAAIDICP